MINQVINESYESKLSKFRSSYEKRKTILNISPSTKLRKNSIDNEIDVSENGLYRVINPDIKMRITSKQ